MKSNRGKSDRTLRRIGAALLALALSLSAIAAEITGEPTGVPQRYKSIGKAASVSIAAAQSAAPAVTGGMPQDWSHRHVIYTNPETKEEAEADGTIDSWQRKSNDPRFVSQLEKRYAREVARATRAAAVAEAEEAVAAEREAARNARQAARNPMPSAPSGAPMHRDWSNVMGGATGAGDSRLYPAKYAFGITTKDCTNDFVVYVTASAGTAGTAGTPASRTGTFTNQPTAGQTATVGNTSHGTSIVLTASATLNTGLNFLIGATATDTATNLANAINRNGGTVGVTASSSTTVVTVTAFTWGNTGSNITLAKTLTNFTWAGASLSGGSGTAAQPTIFALNNLYSDCGTATQGYPSVRWSYNTGIGATADLSPAISINGDQVAFVQKTSSVASLVLLKWSASSPGTIGVPTVPTSVTQANYRSCTAPCMTVITFNGSPNDTYSAPFVDYLNDVIYVGDDAGKLHKFTGVFSGTPAEQTTGGWPATVSNGNKLSPPVYDSGSSNVGSNLVFVGSIGNSGSVGNRLHSVDSSGTVVSSGAIGSASNANGVLDAPIVDSNAQRVYVFIGADNGGADALGVTCSVAACNAIYQFSTASSIATQNSGLGTKVNVGASGANNDINRAMSAGDFDEGYYTSSDSTNPSGNLYVCGSSAATSRRGTIWKVTIANNAFSSKVEGPLLVNKDANDGCSPVTVFKNGSAEYLYVSVSNDGSAAGGSGCATPVNGCIYMYLLPGGASFDATTTSSTINDNTIRYFSVSTSAALNTTESSVATTLTAAQAATYTGMTITQSANSPGGTTFTYFLRKNGANTAITCAIGAGVGTCSDTTNAATFAAGDTIDVSVQRTAGTGNMTNRTWQVQMGFGASTSATAALNATGGTGGIIIDNTASGGGSQVYYSTRTSPGNAVQATQAALN